MTTVEQFFSGGGGKSVKFPTIGTSVTGTVIMVHNPEPQTEFGTGRVLDKMQVRIELATQERDASDPDDDGRRTLYCRGWLTGAIGDALKAAGAGNKPMPGGTLTVTYTGDGTASRPGISGPKQYSASYVAPSATGEFFEAAASPAAAPAAAAAPVAAAAPAGIDPAAWAAMPDDAKKAVLASLSKTEDTPPF